MLRICRQTIFICGKPQWCSKPLKQLGFLPRQEDIRRVTRTSSVNLAVSPPSGGCPSRGGTYCPAVPIVLALRVAYTWKLIALAEPIGGGTLLLYENHSLLGRNHTA